MEWLLQCRGMVLAKKKKRKQKAGKNDRKR